MRLFIKGLAADFEKETGDKAVVFLPGWTGTRYSPQRAFVLACGYAKKKGLSTMRFDFSGRGDSEGNTIDTTIDIMIDNAADIIEWLVAEQGIKQIHLIGLCSGGNIALGVAGMASCAKYIEKITCWSLLPFMEDKEKAKGQGTNRFKRFKELLVKLFSKEGFSKIIHREANIKSALQNVAKDKEGDKNEKRRKTSVRKILNDVSRHYTGDVHLIFGTKDPESAGSELFYREWFDRNRKGYKITKIKGAPHNFYTAHWTEELIEKTLGEE